MSTENWAQNKEILIILDTKSPVTVTVTQVEAKEHDQAACGHEQRACHDYVPKQDNTLSNGDPG